ncbi:hypothetical protein GCM10023334_027650 [Nonomuraea thailandensis]
MPSPKDVQQTRARCIEEAAAAQARKAERRAENERSQPAHIPPRLTADLRLASSSPIWQGYEKRTSSTRRELHGHQ